MIVSQSFCVQKVLKRARKHENRFTHKSRNKKPVGLDSEKRLFSRKDAKRCEKRQNDAKREKRGK